MQTSQTQHIGKMLQKLQETSYISKVFQISSVDEIGTISGFRLGRTQRVDVPQEEINAALGQVVYLLCVQAHHLGYAFDRYHLHACGAFSRISFIKDALSTKYELYLPSSEDRFNKALTMLLDCVHLFISQHVSKFKKYNDNKEVMLYQIS